MSVMICMRGEPDQLPFLPEIGELGAGIELQSYGVLGVKSEQEWKTRFSRHMAVRAQFDGAIAVHGPFTGMDYTHIDHLIREVVARRLDMTFEAARELKASRVVLHGGYKAEVDIFGWRDNWVAMSVDFWRREIGRWADAGIEVVLENDVERSPETLIRVVDGVDSTTLGLCLDVGHQHFVSKLGAVEWVRKMGGRNFHVHLHDNDGTGDRHWPIGRGTIDFESFYVTLMKNAPEATVSLEVEDTMETQMDKLRELAARFA
jgi:sugar phosphate isomerase/epimerase